MTMPLDPLRFPLWGSRLIEASAGTGKTWTIAALYVRLILGHGGAAAAATPLSPDRLLVVTFTKAATEELRDRIRQRLTEAAAVFREHDEGDAFLQGLRADYDPDAWAAQAWRLELAASAMDQAAVLTIHGWCQRMLQEHAFASGVPFAAQLEGDDRVLRQEAARDFWRRFIQPLPVELLREVTACVAEPAALASQIGVLAADPGLATDDQPPAIFTELTRWLADGAQFEATAREACQGDCDAICDWFRAATERGWLHRGSHKAEAVEAQLQTLRAWTSGAAPIEPEALAKLLPEQLRLTKAANGERPGGAGLTALAGYLAWRDRAPSLAAPLLRHAAAWCARRVAAQKRKLGQMSFDDLLTQLHAALAATDGADEHGASPAPGQGATLAKAIRQQFPVALIDEFQDTDPVQYAIFRRIWLDGGAGAAPPGEPERASGLLMIGDPKQAIYGFRGADIYAYLRARRDTAGRHYTLATNFRSTRGMVDAVNTLFGRAEAWPDGAFLLGSDVPFTPVGAQGRGERLTIAGAPQPAMTCWLGGAGEPLSKGDYRQQFAQTCAAAIADLLSEAAAGRAGFEASGELLPVTAADIAVLVRSGYEAGLVRQALASRGLASVYLSDRDSVFGSAEALDLLCWLDAAAAPEQDRLLRRALAAASVGLPLVELERLTRDEDAAERTREQFRRYQHLWRRRGVLPMVRALLDDFGVAGRLLSDIGGERSLTNLLHLAELLQRDADEFDGERGLIGALAQRIAAAQTGEGEEEHVLRLESDADLIRVVTMHKSKGLEYPLVFVPFACNSRPVGSADRVVKYHDEEGALRDAIDPDEAQRAAADRERLAEDVRLLYVTLTRARHACWIGVAPLGRNNRDGYRCDLRHSALGWLLAGGAPIEPVHMVELLAELAAACPHVCVVEPPPAAAPNAASALKQPLQPAGQRNVRVAQPRHELPWWIASYTLLAASGRRAQREGWAEEGDLAGSGREARALELRQAPSEGRAGATTGLGGLHAFPAGARAGSFLHDLLEWAALAGFERVVNDPDWRLRELTRRCRRRGWESWVPLLDDWLPAALQRPLALDDTSVSLASLAAERVQVELEFWLEAHSVAVNQLDQALRRHILPGQPRPPLGSLQLNGMLKGFVDLIFERDGRFWIVDYKSNWLGPDAAAYGREAMEAAVLEHRYDLQYALYTLALHRLLRSRLPDYDYARHMGGVLYLFLRGFEQRDGGVHRALLPLELVDWLDGRFAGEPVQGSSAHA